MPTKFTARKSKRTISFVIRKARTPFPFSRLPRDLRYEIYLLCLASNSPTRIQIDRGSLRLNRYSTSSQIGPFICLLHLNRSIYDEASSVLYEHNLFQFVGREAWAIFYWFHGFLTETNRRRLRNLEFDFPAHQLEDRWLSRGGRGAGIECLKGLQHLNTLTLCVSHDITRDDISMLEKIHDNCPHRC